MPRFKVPRSTRTMYGTVTPAVVVVVARSAGAVPGAYGLKQLLVGAGAGTSWSPRARSVTTPRRVRAAALPRNEAVTSRPLSRKLDWFSGTFFRTRTSSSASRPLTRSARFDSDTLWKLHGPSPGWAVA